MSERQPTERSDNVENLEEFMLHNQTAIVQRLKQLAKSHCLVTAHFDSGATLTTSVIDIIREMELVVLDCGVDEKLMQQLLQSDRVIFKSQHEGVTVQFTAASLTKAKFHNEPVIAIPIPSSMLWIQRRHAYRVRIPLGMPIYCTITVNPDSLLRLKVYDLSAGGLSLSDEEQQLQMDKGNVLEDCELELGDFGRLKIKLQIRNCFPINKRNLDAGQRVGCAFHQLGMTDSTNIQRYIHSVETLRKRTED